MNVKILAPVVGFVLYVPHPPIAATSTLVGPEILAIGMGSYFLRVKPKLRNVLIVASADTTTLALAEFLH